MAGYDQRKESVCIETEQTENLVVTANHIAQAIREGWHLDIETVFALLRQSLDDARPTQVCSQCNRVVLNPYYEWADGQNGLISGATTESFGEYESDDLYCRECIETNRQENLEEERLHEELEAERDAEDRHYQKLAGEFG